MTTIPKSPIFWSLMYALLMAVVLSLVFSTAVFATDKPEPPTPTPEPPQQERSENPNVGGEKDCDDRLYRLMNKRECQVPTRPKSRPAITNQNYGGKL